MATRVLLSMKPKFAHAILDGKKRFEFRRALFQRDGIERIVIYASTPEKRVVGEFLVAEVLSLAPAELWEKTRKHAGIDKIYFDRYFSGKKQAHAIKVVSPRRYKRPLELLRHYGLARAPQSFCYLS